MNKRHLNVPHVKQTGTKKYAETDGVIVTAIMARRKNRDVFKIHHSFNLAVSSPLLQILPCLSIDQILKNTVSY